MVIGNGQILVPLYTRRSLSEEIKFRAHGFYIRHVLRDFREQNFASILRILIEKTRQLKAQQQKWRTATRQSKSPNSVVSLPALFRNEKPPPKVPVAKRSNPISAHAQKNARNPRLFTAHVTVDTT